MDQLGGELLADASFTRDEHVGFGAGDARDVAPQVPDRLAVADDRARGGDERRDRRG
jgi:hypothetical protein